jgi:hypothetical protein
MSRFSRDKPEHSCGYCLLENCNGAYGGDCTTEKCDICNSVICPRFSGPKRCQYIYCNTCGMIRCEEDKYEKSLIRILKTFYNKVK